MPETLSRARWRLLDCKVQRGGRAAREVDSVVAPVGEPPTSDCAFGVRVGNTTIVAEPGFDPAALTYIVRALEQC